MRRIVSSAALSGWLGFALVSLLLPATSALGGASTSGLSASGLATSALTGERVAALSTLLGLVAAIGLLVASLYVLHAPQQRPRSAGLAEKLGAIGFLTLGLVATLAPLAGVDPFRADEASLGFWSLLLLSVGALWFDRAIAVDEGTDDNDEDFGAAIGVIAQSMARQTRLYAHPPLRQTDRTL